MDHLKSELVYSLMKDAACEGKTETLEKLLDVGLDVNHEYPEGSTLLHYACQSKQQQTIRILLQNGADVEKLDKEGTPAINIGIYQGDMDTLRIFLTYSSYDTEYVKRYMDISKCDFLNKIVQFFKDVQENKVEVIKDLSQIENIDLQVILNTRNKKGNSLFLIAFVNKYEKIAFELMNLVIKKGIEIFLLDHLEKIKTGLSEMVGGLNFLGFNFQENKYFSLIRDINNLNILTAFLTVIERKLQDGYAKLLIKTCKENNIENVEKSITRARENLNKNVCKKGMPYQYKELLVKELELRGSNFPRVKMILLHNTSWKSLRTHVINSTTADGTTPLQIAARNDNVNIIKLLFKYGALIYCKKINAHNKTVTYEPIIAQTGQESHNLFKNMIEYFKSKGTAACNFDSKTDKSFLLNARGKDHEAVWYQYIGYPDDDIKLNLLNLIVLDEEIIEQNFIL